MRSHQLSMEEPGNLGIFALLANALMFPQSESRSRERPEAGTTAVTSRPPEPRRNPLARLDHWFWIRQQRDLEAHLAKATDVYDLEVRIRALERNAPHSYY